MLKRTLTTLSLSAALLLAGCGTDSPASDAAGTPVTAAEDVVDGVRSLTLTPVGNEMKFAQTEILASAGETIRIVFNNTATSPAMHHNVLFVSDEGSIEAVGRAAMDAGDRDFIPDHPAVIASTPMAAPGETVELTFTVPGEPGDYPFICTYPGHYMMMRGTLRVTD